MAPGAIARRGRFLQIDRQQSPPGLGTASPLAHVDPAPLPSDLLLGRFTGKPGVESVTEPLDVGDLTACRARGERFLDAGDACALRVPSVVLPQETNYLVNVLHPEASGIRLVAERSFFFDERLVA